jgi:ParB-like chromosome segregation protein Spo0J
MGVRSYFEQVDPSTLRPCPKNKHVFGPTDSELNPEFLASIKEDGVLAPIIVNSKRMICDGHRRTAAAVKMGLKSVPCYVSDHEDIDKTLHAWDTLQKQVRVRTKEQTARLFGQYKAEEAEAAESCRKSENTNESDLSHGETQENDRPDMQIKQRSDEIAAQRVGMSRPTAARALAVVKEIDKAEAEGNVDRAEDLREKLENQPINTAYRAAVAPTVTPSENDEPEEDNREWTKPDASAFRKAFQTIIRTIDRGAELDQLTVAQHAEFLRVFKKLGNDWQKLFPQQEWL